jgi:hypothetical protein
MRRLCALSAVGFLVAYVLPVAAAADGDDAVDFVGGRFEHMEGSGGEVVGGNGPGVARARAMVSSRFMYGARLRGRDGSRTMT